MCCSPALGRPGSEQAGRCGQAWDSAHEVAGEESAALVVCMPVMQLATGFLLAELKWQEFARQLGEARKDFFFFLLSLPHIRFLLCCGTSVLSPRRRQLMKITQQVPTVMGLVTDQRKLETNLTKNK